MPTPQYTQLTPFKRCVLQNFPFIEADFDALTNYALLSKIVEYLNNVISSQNEVQTNVEALNNAFITLQNFVNTYFANLDVQAEIDNKLDEMAQSGELAQILNPLLDAFRAEINTQLNTFENDVNARITSIDNKVDSAVSGNPIPVSSTAGMTDTTKTYLLTSDGYWYYYNGSEWARGGVYQSTDISDLSIGAEKTKFAKRSENLIDIVNANILNAHPGGSNSTMSPTPNVRSLYIPCEANTTYIITRSVTSGRFAVCDSAVTPTTSSTYSNKTEANTASSITHTTNSTAEYLIVYYWNTNYSPNTPAEALEDLCVLKGSENRGVIPSYVIEVDTIQLDNSAVTPEKTNFNKNSSNLYDVNNSNTIKNHATGGVLQPSNLVRSIYIPCEGGTNYVIHKRQSARFSVCGTASVPATDVAYTNLKTDNNATQIKYTTDATANYLVVFVYNANYDTLTLDQILASIVIIKGTDDIENYIPYGKIIEVTTDNINDKAVTPAKLSDNLRDMIMLSGSLASRNGIYGVTYDLTSTSSACQRVGNAVGLNNDYMIEDTFARNGGHNDFDNIFPWSDIRRCNVKVSAPDGQKTIVYEGESGFTLDGSNGDVMVEIPKFYSYRERIGNIETIAISGERKSGFVCEPAFVVNGQELEHIYVGCYNQAPAYQGSHSYSGDFPVGNKTLSENKAELATSNMMSYDFATFLMLQKLAIIEFADRGIQQYLGGMTRLPYWTSNTTNIIDGFGENYITFQANVGQGTMSSFWVGERIRVGGTNENDMTNVRIITDISQSGTQITVTYDGEDMSDSLHVGDGVGCYAQRNGLCDAMTYHTGRRDFVPSSSIANYVNPMRYRYIENIIGNIWEQIAGLRVRGLQPYFTFEPNIDEPVSSGVYQTTSYGLPLQNMYPSSNEGWIIDQGYDQNNRLVNLPTDCGVEGGLNKYFAGTFYSKDVSGTEYMAMCCGAWDTYYWANVNTLRVWEAVGTHSNLYGNRPIYRG